MVDEVRISGFARSEDWIATEYLNQSNPEDFYTFSSQSDYSEYEFVVCDNDTVIYSVPDLYTGYTWTADGVISFLGSSTNSIEVVWNGSGADEISLTVNQGATCSGSSPNYSVVVNPSPAPNITGNDTVCPSATGEIYNTALQGGHSYFWNLSGQSSFTGQNTNEVTVDWSAGPTGQLIIYDTITATGCGATDTLGVRMVQSVAPVIREIARSKSGCCRINDYNQYTIIRKWWIRSM